MKTETQSHTRKRTFSLYQCPVSLAQNAIEQFVDDQNRWVIIHHMHCGEDIAPNPYRFDNIKDARAMWMKLHKVITSRGYVFKAA